MLGFQFQDGCPKFLVRSIRAYEGWGREMVGPLLEEVSVARSRETAAQVVILGARGSVVTMLP